MAGLIYSQSAGWGCAGRGTSCSAACRGRRHASLDPASFDLVVGAWHPHDAISIYVPPWSACWQQDVPRPLPLCLLKVVWRLPSGLDLAEQNLLVHLGWSRARDPGSSRGAGAGEGEVQEADADERPRLPAASLEAGTASPGGGMHGDAAGCAARHSSDAHALVGRRLQVLDDGEWFQGSVVALDLSSVRLPLPSAPQILNPRPSPPLR